MIRMGYMDVSTEISSRRDNSDAVVSSNRENVSAPSSLASVHPGPILISYNYLPIFPTVVRLWTGGGNTQGPEIIVAGSETSRSN